jgi:UDP-glucose 4-epimerase
MIAGADSWNCGVASTAVTGPSVVVTVVGLPRLLLALENLSSAIEAVLAVPGPLRPALIAADPQALTVAEMIAAMRGGLGRRANVFPLPPGLLEILLRAAGQGEIYDRISGSLVADPSVLISLGWAPPVTTPA